VQSDAAVAGRGTRLTALVRLGGRSSRLVRLMRMARAVQVLRLIPRLQRWMDRGTQDLALLLLHKRLWHLYSWLRRGDLLIGDEDLAILHTALVKEFPAKTDEKATPQISAAIVRRLGEVSNRIDFTKTQDGHGTFRRCVRAILARPEGKRAFQRCVDDIMCMKDSCSIMEQGISRVTLKICLLVLAMLIVIPLLEVPVTDLSMDTGLGQLHAMAAGTPRLGVDKDLLCTQMRRYADLMSSVSLEVLVLHHKVYWDAALGCFCCGTGQAVADLADLAGDYLETLPLETSEYIVLCHPEADCDVASSLAIFDISDEVRFMAVYSLLYTMAVVVSMVLLILFFAGDMKRLFNKKVMFPLYELIDDMCGLRVMEILDEVNGQRSLDPFFSTQMRKACLKSRPNLFTRTRHKISLAFTDEMPISAEVMRLREAFVHLRSAMSSWSKYVPAILLKQLFEAGIEATIGCSRNDVTVVFCDIGNVEDICLGKSPQEVLVMLASVLEMVTESIEDNGGVLLEFIGDEVLAIFNAPIPISDHTRCALSAVTEMLQQLNQIEAFTVKLQCSVHRATVLAGNLGSPTRMKYGVMGDGVNLTARLKSLNSRYGTKLLASSEGLDFAAARDDFVTRPIGNLVLKGRNTPTPTFEVLARRSAAPEAQVRGAEAHTQAFELFTNRRFAEARALFEKARALLLEEDDAGGEDYPSRHLMDLCDGYIGEPPPASWDGSEKLTKKVW